ncbi:hypothetical protein Ciccas_008644, partial [Cichlidogyrus casuarinus]
MSSFQQEVLSNHMQVARMLLEAFEVGIREPFAPQRSDCTSSSSNSHANKQKDAHNSFPNPCHDFKHYNPLARQLDLKPNFSYIGLIAKAILSTELKRMVLAEIYQWIQHHYPYFRERGPGWRNSIRHNLSLNDCFIKVGRSANGKGHYWGIHPANISDFMKGDFRRRRAQRKVRRAMGILCGPDEDDPDSPCSSPPPVTCPQEDHVKLRKLLSDLLGPAKSSDVQSNYNLMKELGENKQTSKNDFSVARLLKSPILESNMNSLSSCDSAVSSDSFNQSGSSKGQQWDSSLTEQNSSGCGSEEMNLDTSS